MDSMKPEIYLPKKSIELLYGNKAKKIKLQFERYENIANKFKENFKAAELHFFSTPGRTEISGNHTDHNHGCVLAASIDLDSVAAVSKCDEYKIELISDGYEQPFYVDLNQLEPVEDESGTTTSLIRGIASRFQQLGYRIG